MNDRFGHVAQRLFNTPLALHPRKAEMVISAAFDRLGYGAPVMVRPDLFARWDDDEGDGNFGAPRRTAAPDEGFDRIGPVARITVSGTLVQKLGSLRPYSGMTGYTGLRQAFCNALAAPDVEGVMLDIDSGGGEVAGLFDLVDLVHAARGEKPIAALLTESAYSAAYALASAADPGRLYVPRTGGVGSIGVICARVDFSQRLEKDGIKVTFIHTGARKADGHPELAPTDEEFTALQAEVDFMGGLFHETVGRNRGLAASAVAGMQAATFLGAPGVACGLADKVMSPDAAFRDFVAQLH